MYSTQHADENLSSQQQGWLDICIEALKSNILLSNKYAKPTSQGCLHCFSHP
jgi:hypothetical protein